MQQFRSVYPIKYQMFLLEKLIRELMQARKDAGHPVTREKAEIMVSQMMFGEELEQAVVN